VLHDRRFVGFLPITDAARAKKFYCDVPGCRCATRMSTRSSSMRGGTPLRLAVVPQVPERAGTNGGWLVDDVNASVRALASAGVTFERFPGMDQDPDGVWRPSPDTGGVAWFRDPDGNRLSPSHDS
jgi:catechol 2,3-dioxygenase-like lactoylglutathione lyase family enzyme